MKRFLNITIIGFLLIVLIGILQLNILINNNRKISYVLTGAYKNYMLKNMGNSEKDKYVLVRFHVGNKDNNYDFIREVINDNKILNKNRNVFYIANREDAYGTTCEGFFDLYKNGELIAKEIYDPYMEVTKMISYGTLEGNFIKVTKEQLDEILKK